MKAFLMNDFLTAKIVCSQVRDGWYYQFNKKLMKWEKYDPEQGFKRPLNQYEMAMLIERDDWKALGDEPKKVVVTESLKNAIDASMRSVTSVLFEMEKTKLQLKECCWDNVGKNFELYMKTLNAIRRGGRFDESVPNNSDSEEEKQTNGNCNH